MSITTIDVANRLAHGLVVGSLQKLRLIRFMVGMVRVIRPRPALTCGLVAGGLGAVGVVGLVVLIVRKDPLLQRMRTKVIDMCSAESLVDQRAVFREIVIAPNAAQKGKHSHATAAAIRSNMNHALDDYVQKTGRSVYSVSMSAADERRGLRGNRYYYHSKDMAYGSKNDQMEAEDVIKMSDTGYYLNLPDYMHGQEVVLYEICPVRAAAGAADGTYRFDESGCLTEIVNGDAKYRHALWDLSTDHVLVRTWFGAWVYLVEKILHPQYPEYRVTGLFPRRYIWNPAAWLVDIKPLVRRRVVNGNWCIIDSLHNDHNDRGVVYTSLARLGDNFDVFLPKEVLTTIIARLKVVKHMELGGIEMMLEVEKADERYIVWRETSQSIKSSANIILDYFKDGYPKAYGMLTAPRSDCFTPLNEKYRPMTDPVVPNMRNVLPPGKSPLFAGAVVPSKSAASEVSAVEGRIIGVRNDVKPPGRFMRYAKDFVEEMVPNSLMYTGTAVGLDEVFRRQARPTQRSLLERAQDWWGCQKLVNKFFIKRETGGKVNYPRVISTTSETFKTEYSSVIYSLVDTVLHRAPWYAFGRSPAELVEALSARAQRAQTCSATDFSFYDGTISEFLREFVERPILLRFFEPRTAEKAWKLHASQAGQPGFGCYGTRAPTGPYRRSGSPETSSFNSIDGAFITYCAFREMGVEHKLSYDNLGFHGGDDGLAFDIDAKILENTVKKFGMTLKADVLKRGDPLPFLGRIWFGAWYGATTSMADVPRQTQKLQLTTQADSVSVEEVLRSKAIGYMLTDRRTPVIGVWAAQILKLTAKGDTPPDNENLDLSWFARCGAIFDQPDEDAAYFDTCFRYKIDAAAIDKAEKHILQAKTVLDTFSDHPFHVPAAVAKIDAMLNGERVGPNHGKPGATKTTVAEPAKAAAVATTKGTTKVAAGSKPPPAKQPDKTASKKQPVLKSVGGMAMKPPKRSYTVVPTVVVTAPAEPLNSFN